MRRVLLIATFFGLLIFPSNVFAHPGSTAKDGCHYCRTNCDKWGVPWNQRHCHNGGTPAPTPGVPKVVPPKITLPTQTPKPVIPKTVPPKITPTIKPSLTAPTSSPTASVVPPKKIKEIKPTEKPNPPTVKTTPTVTKQTDLKKFFQVWFGWFK